MCEKVTYFSLCVEKFDAMYGQLKCYVFCNTPVKFDLKWCAENITL